MRRALLLSLFLSLVACGSDGGSGDANSDGSDNADEGANGNESNGDDNNGGADNGGGDNNGGNDGSDEKEVPREEPFVVRPLTMSGLAISYSPYRDGQSPERETPNGGGVPSKEAILEDLRILERGGWKNIRTYASGEPSKRTIEVIDENDIDIKVMLGAWLEPETDEAAKQRNEEEVQRALKLAADHPTVVAAISVANEVLVEWSTHKVPQDRVIYFVRKVRAATNLPVTVADNWNWWRTQGGTLAQEVDFVVLHTYPFWERFDINLDDPNDTKAIDYTKYNYQSVVDRKFERPVVIGEAGWATKQVYNPQIVNGAASEEKQKVYYNQLMEWTTAENILCFTFEAFDENWKGGPSPNEQEKNWGLFKADRTPKLVMQDMFPDLEPSTLK